MSFLSKLFSQKFSPINREKSNVSQTLETTALPPLETIPITIRENIISTLFVVDDDLKTEVANLVKHKIRCTICLLSEL